MFKLIPIALMCIGAAVTFAEPGAEDRGEVSYQVGMKALDAKQWQNAIAEFDGVPPDNARADGALYWRAYAFQYKAPSARALSGGTPSNSSMAFSHCFASSAFMPPS